MNREVIICCAVTGAADNASRHPDLPITPKQIATAAIEAAISAVKKHGWSRAQVSVPGRPGKNGGLQQVWWGVGAIGQSGDPESQRCQVWHCLDVPGYGLGGFLGYYWTVDADIDRWNGELFRSQAATMTELTGVLMTSDLDAIAPR
jgi:hypothetical protein